MDKLINSHIDKLEEIEDAMDSDIEKALSQIDIDAIMENPEVELARITEALKQRFIDEYAPKAVEIGVQFGKSVEKKIDQDKTIKVDDSNDPKLNAES